MQTKDDMNIELIPNISYDIFILGDEIKNYSHLKSNIHHYNDIDDPYDSYFFINEKVTVWVKDGVIDSIRCTEHCYWLGQDLIGMKFDFFLMEYKIVPESSQKLYVHDGAVNQGQNQVAYDFDREGLLIWVWRNKIKTVLISAYDIE